MSSLRRLKAAAWAIGPGLIVMLADTDAGNVVAAAQAGASWRFRLLPLVLALTPVLYMVQELTVRLGLFTGRGHGDLIRERFGAGWAWLSVAGLSVATLGSMITQFSAVAGIGELYGVARGAALAVSAALLLAIVVTGSYRRVERIAVAIGLLELAFFAVALSARPDIGTLAHDAINLPLGDRKFLYVAAAIIGATFNPWMAFYQQAAVAQKKLLPQDYRLARADTAFGAILTQLLTGAVLVAAAATLGAGGNAPGLSSIGEISQALSPLLGGMMGRLVFCAGVLGAAMVAAIVSSLALAWGVSEAAGYQRSLDDEPLDAKGFYLCYALCIVGAAALVYEAPDLVWLTVGAQVLNVFLLPLVIGFLVALATAALPPPLRPNGLYLVALILSSTIVCLFGLIGGVAGFL
jgi:NRAMP (natural resistance-associated macrophage protein)-like metal ion transporter